jgi:hypothetical protein
MNDKVFGWKRIFYILGKCVQDVWKMCDRCIERQRHIRLVTLEIYCFIENLIGPPLKALLSFHFWQNDSRDVQNHYSYILVLGLCNTSSYTLSVVIA